MKRRVAVYCSSRRLPPAPAPADDVLALDEALERLCASDPVKGELVQLRYFGGLTLDEAAAVLGIAPATADRYWAFARAWLYRELTGGEGAAEKPGGA